MLSPFEILGNSSDTSTRQSLAAALNALRPLELSAEELASVELVLAEVLNNIVEHAYPAGAPPGPIKTVCTHLQDGLHFTVSDRGQRMPDDATPLGVRPTLDVQFDDLPDGGFGWFLIKDLAKDVQYLRVEDENILKMRIAISVAKHRH